MKARCRTVLYIVVLFALTSQTFAVSKIGFLDPYWIIRHLRYRGYSYSPADTMLCWDILNSRSGYFPLVGDSLGLDMCWSLCDPWASQLLAAHDLKLASEWYPDSTWKYVEAQQENYNAGSGGYFDPPLSSVGEFVEDSDTRETRQVVRSLYDSHSAGDIIPETHLGYGWLGGHRMYNFKKLPPYDGTDTLFVKVICKWDSATTHSTIAQISLSPIDTFEMTCVNAASAYGVYDSLVFALGYRWASVGLQIKVHWPKYHDLYIDRIEVYDRAFRHLFYDNDREAKLSTVTASLVQYDNYVGEAHYNFRIDEPAPRTFRGFSRVDSAYRSAQREIAVMLNPDVLDGGFSDFVEPDALFFFKYTLGGDSFQSGRRINEHTSITSYFTSHNSDVAYIDSFRNTENCNHFPKIHSLQHSWDMLVGSPDHGEEYEWGLYKMQQEAVAAGSRDEKPWHVYLMAGQEIGRGFGVTWIDHRDPTPNEMHGMAWLALSFGPDGIGWYRVAGDIWDSELGVNNPEVSDCTPYENWFERTHGLLDWKLDDGSYADGPEDHANGAAFLPTERFYAAQAVHAMLDTIGPVLDRLQWVESNATRAFEMSNTIPIHFPSGTNVTHWYCEKSIDGSSWVSEPLDSTYLQYAGFTDLSRPQDFGIMVANRRCLAGEKRRAYFRLYDIPDTTYAIRYYLADTLILKKVYPQNDFMELQVSLEPGRGEFIYVKAAGPHIMVEPQSLDFGDVHVDSTDNLAVAVNDTGDWELQITNMEFAIGQGFEIVPTPEWPDTVQARDSLVYMIQFAPTDTGNFVDTLCIFHDAGDTIRVILQGKGTQEALLISPDSLNFNLTRVAFADTLNINVSNPGTADLYVYDMLSSESTFEVFLPADSIRSRGNGSSPLSRAGQRALYGHLDDISFTVEPGDSQVALVTFTPIQEIAYSGTLMVLSSLPDVEISLDGIGAAPHIVVQPLGFNFEDVHVDSIENFTFTVNDTGDWNLLITTMEFTSGQACELFPAPEWPDTIAARDSAGYTIRFAPFDTGIVNDTLQIFHDAGESVQVLLQGRGIQEALSLSSDSLDFSFTRVESSDTLEFYVTNPGTADLFVYDIVSPDSVFEVLLPAAPIANQGNSTSRITRAVRNYNIQLLSGNHDGTFSHLDEIAFTVEPGDSQLVYVIFTPIEEIDTDGVLTIQSSLPDVEISVAGIGAAPHISVEPYALNFGDVHADSTVSRTVTVSDTGDWDLLITSMEFTLGHVFEFIPAPEWPDTVMVWNSLIYSVRFAPLDTGIFKDTLRILHDAGDPDSVLLVGRGVSYEMVLNSDSLDFGQQWLNTTSQDSFLITNTGNVPLEIDSIICHDDGFHFAQLEPFIIEPANSVSVSLPFTPLDTLEYVGTVTIFSNAGAPMIAVSGHGVWTELAAHPDTIEFGGIGIAESADTTVLLESSGNTHISSIMASLLIGDAFTITHWPSDSIAAYGSTEMEVLFVSSDTGAFKDTLMITHCVGSPIYIPLSAVVSAAENYISALIPTDYYLHPNFPNPFNPSTTFRFGVPQTSHVTITVYDVLGRQVDTLTDGMIQAGHRQVVWNCRNCTSGVYLVVMSGDGFKIVQKATLIR